MISRNLLSSRWCRRELQHFITPRGQGAAQEGAKTAFQNCVAGESHLTSLSLGASSKRWDRRASTQRAKNSQGHLKKSSWRTHTHR